MDARDILLSYPFWSKVERADGCWLWAGSRNKNGYGVFWIAGKRVSAHRHSYELAKGPIPEGKHVLHKCDNPPCVLFEHLFLGTNADNVVARDRKRRQAVGENNGRAVLTAALVAEIRALYATGEYTQKELGDKFGVSQPRISYIVNYKSWQAS